MQYDGLYQSNFKTNDGYHLFTTYVYYIDNNGYGIPIVEGEVILKEII